MKWYSVSLKSLHYWSLTIRLFNIISRTLVVREVLPLCRDAVCVFYSPSQLGLKSPDAIIKIWSIYIYLPTDSMSRIWHKVNFQVKFNKFEFRIFLLLVAVPWLEPILPYYLLIAGLTTDYFMLFLRTSKWNTNSQDFSSDH